MVGKCEWLSIVLSAFGDYIRWRRFQAPNAALVKTAWAKILSRSFGRDSWRWLRTVENKSGVWACELVNAAITRCSSKACFVFSHELLASLSHLVSAVETEIILSSTLIGFYLFFLL